MPVPQEYKRASVDFDRFLVDARDISGLATTHQTYTMVQGVLQALRRRRTPREVALFANVLPPLLRALFVADWNPDEPSRPFEGRDVLAREVQALRRDHNFAPESSIRDVATALRKNIDGAALDRVLAQLPPGATDFWRTD